MATLQDAIDANAVIYHGFDIDELRTVAECILVVNGYTIGMTVEDIMKQIRDIGVKEIEPGRPTYVSTMGFCVSGYHKYGDKSDWSFKVTLTAYTVNEYLRGKGLLK